MTEAASTPVLSHHITLAIPAKEKTNLTMSRPKTRHIRQLNVLFGQEVIKAMFEDSSKLKDMITSKKAEISDSAFSSLLQTLLSDEKIGELLKIVADLCDVEPDVLDDIDPIDWPKFGEALQLFFPGLSGLFSKSDNSSG